MHNIKDLGLKRSPAIRLKIAVQTDRRKHIQTESISEHTLKIVFRQARIQELVKGGALLIIFF